MQTFLPLTEFLPSANTLDNLRLGNQLGEVLRIYENITGLSTSWQHHPVVAMWRGYPDALIAYGCACYTEWTFRFTTGKRGGKPLHFNGELLESFAMIKNIDLVHYLRPPWLGDERLHSSHRACLLAKNYAHYSQFGWTETPTPPNSDGKWPYYWPV